MVWFAAIFYPWINSLAEFRAGLGATISRACIITRRRRAHVSENVHVCVDGNAVELQAPPLTAAAQRGSLSTRGEKQRSPWVHACVKRARLGAIEHALAGWMLWEARESEETRTTCGVVKRYLGARAPRSGLSEGVQWHVASMYAGSRSELKGRGVRRTERMGHGEKQGSEGRPSKEATAWGRERGGQGFRLKSTRRCRPRAEDIGDTLGQTDPVTTEAGTMRGWVRRHGDTATQDRKTSKKGRKGQVKPTTYPNVNQHACASQMPGTPKMPRWCSQTFLRVSEPAAPCQTRTQTRRPGGRLEGQKNATQDTEVQAQNDSRVVHSTSTGVVALATKIWLGGRPCQHGEHKDSEEKDDGNHR
ncbi:hypothetical protein C8R44DRAFT_755349 [Mycena epipterygia]|nr:hypothetical protein C8R44DRAFT_755349 [Mycena epipterygia]